MAKRYAAVIIGLIYITFAHWTVAHPRNTHSGNDSLIGIWKAKNRSNMHTLKPLPSTSQRTLGDVTLTSSMPPVSVLLIFCFAPHLLISI